MPVKARARRKPLAAPVPTIKAWSASRVFDYELCPAKLAFSQTLPRIEPDPDSPLAVGKRLHAEGEAYLQGKVRKVPTFYRYFEKDLQALRKAKAIPEQQWAFRSDWSPCGWFDSDVWCRMAIDALVVRKKSLRIVDFKTGGLYTKDEDQLELYALGGFHRHPEVGTITAELWYLKSDQSITLTIDRGELPALQRRWESRANALLEATEFPPKPGPPGRWPCKWCDWSKLKGGPCVAG